MPKQPISNAGSDPDVLQRRTGGSPNDPHGGHQRPGNESSARDPNPADEMVPGGSGSLPPAKGRKK